MAKTKLFILTLVCLVLLTAQVLAETSNTEGTNSIAGSWIVTGTPDAQTGIPEFVNLATMTRNGTVINVDPVEGASVGEWKKTGNRTFSITFRGFALIDGQSVTLRVRGTSKLATGGKTFDGPFVTDIFDASGNILFSFSGTVHGERFKVEKL